MTDHDATIGELLELQRQLQVNSYGQDPATRDVHEKIESIKENVQACCAELFEALDECSWKSWQHATYLNRDAYVKELVDAHHFLNNAYLTVGATGEEITQRYYEKNRRNALRQMNGYTGLEKCGSCGSELDDPIVTCTSTSCTRDEPVLETS